MYHLLKEVQYYSGLWFCFLESILYKILLIMDREVQLSLKDFEVVRDLGFGSYGRVQLVKKKADKKLYAMKSMFLANAKQKQKEGALNQIRLLASIDMPYVISYKCSFYVPEAQSLCIVMEYADGGDLQAKINQHQQQVGRSGFDEKFIWKTAHQILKGLKGLHQNNIIHRDMKCANIFFVGGVAKIGDMNISKITDNGFATTQTGTPYYTSPEIWKGQKYDYKCDIWALGCIIYEMCCMLPPFRAQDFPGLFQAVTNGVYQDIPKKYTKNLKEFISLCLKVDPVARPGASALLQKPFFAEFELSAEQLATNLEQKSRINLIEPIECPKMLKFLNEKLPRSKFEQNNKKTVCFADRASKETTFKIKSKKFRSEKTIVIDPDEQDFEERQLEMSTVKVTTSKSSKKILPPLEKEQEKTSYLKSVLKKTEIKSMKNITQEGTTRRLLFR